MDTELVNGAYKVDQREGVLLEAVRVILCNKIILKDFIFPSPFPRCAFNKSPFCTHTFTPVNLENAKKSVHV